LACEVITQVLLARQDKVLFLAGGMWLYL